MDSKTLFQELVKEGLIQEEVSKRLQAEAVVLNKKGEVFSLAGFGKIAMPEKGLDGQTKMELKVVSDAISKLLKEIKTNIKEVALALPEAQIFTRVIEMPIMSEAEMASAIKWEAEQYVPLPLSEASLDFTILDKKEADNKMNVLLVAAPTVLINKYKTIVEEAGLSLIAIETEITSLSRAFMDSQENAPVTAIIDIGGQTSCLAIMKQGILAFTRSIQVGGISLTRAIAQSLSLEEEQAENYKKTYGLAQDKMDGKVREAILPIIEVL